MNNGPHRQQRAGLQSGVTLVEMMITLLILAVIVTLVVPGFRTLILNNRIYTQVNDFHLSLSRARAEAMSRVKRVTVCVADVSDPNNPSCDNTRDAWEDGWIVFVEEHGSQDAILSAGEEVLEIQQGLSGGNTLVGDANFKDYVSYVGTGFTTKVAADGGGIQTGKLVLCDEREISNGKVVMINAAGRPRVVDSSGNASSCNSP